MSQKAGMAADLFGGMMQAGGEMMNTINRALGAGLFAANAGNIGTEIHRLGNTFGDSTAALTDQTRGYLNQATNRLNALHAQYGSGSGNLQQDAARGYLHDMRVREGEALRDIQNFAGQQLASDTAQQQEALDVNRDELLGAQYGGQLTSGQRIALQQQAQFASERNLGNRSQQLSAITQQMRNETRQAYTGAIADAHRTLVGSIGNDREFAVALEQLDAGVRNAYISQIAQLDQLAMGYYMQGPTYNYQALTQLVGFLLNVNPGDPYKMMGQQIKETGQALVAMAQQNAASDSGGGMF